MQTQPNHGIDLHRDEGYDSCDPITGFSFGTGASLVIAYNNTLKMGKNAVLIYQPINSATVMAGNFQLEYQHGVPSFNQWPEIMEKNSWKSNLIDDIIWADGPKGELQDEFNRLSQLSQPDLGDKSNWRFNCALRWHREHKPDCPAGKRTGREDGLLQSAGSSGNQLPTAKFQPPIFFLWFSLVFVACFITLHFFPKNPMGFPPFLTRPRDARRHGGFQSGELDSAAGRFLSLEGGDGGPELLGPALGVTSKHHVHI